MKTDILIVGAGPAGLGASIEAARCGAKVLVVDENLRAGGQLYKQIHKFFGSKEQYAGIRGFQIAEKLIEEAEALNVTIWTDTRALGLMDDGSVAVLHNSMLETVAADKVILAVGGKENALPFKGWTLPGVMTAGAAQTFSNVHGILVGKKIIMVGSGNVGLITSYQLMQGGADIVGVVEAAPGVTGYGVHANKLRRTGVPFYFSHTVVEACGDGCVEEAVIARVDERFKVIPGTEKRLKADTILLAVGLNPRTELAGMFKCAMTYEGALGGILPVHDEYMRSSNHRVYVCGDQTGVEEANTALEEGRLAGLHAALSLGFKYDGDDERVKTLQKNLCELRSGVNAEKRLKCKERIIQKGAACYE